jgi:hypothetical protein
MAYDTVLGWAVDGASRARAVMDPTITVRNAAGLRPSHGAASQSSVAWMATSSRAGTNPVRMVRVGA